MCGIPPVRGNIIRPLINCTRQEIEDFLKERGQDFVTDSTNLTDDYTRNKIRHLVVPRLAELNSSLFGSYAMTADRLRTDSDYLESQGLEAFEKAVLPLLLFFNRSQPFVLYYIWLLIRKLYR